MGGSTHIQDIYKFIIITIGIQYVNIYNLIDNFLLNIYLNILKVMTLIKSLI